MICAACGQPGEDAPTCAACGADPLLRARWRLCDRLGEGAQGVVYRATAPGAGEVAVKELPVGRHLPADAVGACDREARVLRELHHPGIPTFVDAFVAHRSLWVIQEFVEGESLAEEAKHHRYTEAEVLAVVEELLGVLAYLHGLSPPVVHRDIKPSNVTRRPDGRLALVDFGSVRDSLVDGATRGTTAGTFGYMAPEQLRGEASPASDLYGLGALAVGLLARVEPATLLDWNHRLQWRRNVQVSAGTASLLARMVAPDPGKRPSSAKDLRAEVRRLRDGKRPPGRFGLALLGAFGVLAALTAGFTALGMFPEPRLVPGRPEPVRGGKVAVPVEEASPSWEAPPTSEAAPSPSPTAAPAATTPTPPEPSVPEPKETAPADLSGPIGSLIRDPATGLLFKKLGEGAAVECAHSEVLGLLTAQLAYDAAFDTYQPKFSEVGWAPGPKCKWYVAFATDIRGGELVLHALITRGEGRGRHLVANREGDVFEEPRIADEAIRALLAGPLEWMGNRNR